MTDKLAPFHRSFSAPPAPPVLSFNQIRLMISGIETHLRANCTGPEFRAQCEATKKQLEALARFF